MHSADHSNLDQLNNTLNVLTLKNCLNTADFPNRDNLSDEENELRRKKLLNYEGTHNQVPCNTGLRHSLSRHELNQLPNDVKHEIIAEMAIEHNHREIKAGHVVNNKKTNEYVRHPLPEVNAVLFGYPCPKYQPCYYGNMEDYEYGM